MDEYINNHQGIETFKVLWATLNNTEKTVFLHGQLLGNKLGECNYPIASFLIKEGATGYSGLDKRKELIEIISDNKFDDLPLHYEKLLQDFDNQPHDEAPPEYVRKGILTNFCKETLNIAASLNNVDIIKYTVEKILIPNRIPSIKALGEQTSSHNFSPLCTAIENNSADVAIWLVKNNQLVGSGSMLDVEEPKDYRHQTPWNEAISKGNVAVVNCLASRLGHQKNSPECSTLLQQQYKKTGIWTPITLTPLEYAFHVKDEALSNNLIDQGFKITNKAIEIARTSENQTLIDLSKKSSLSSVRQPGESIESPAGTQNQAPFSPISPTMNYRYGSWYTLTFCIGIPTAIMVIIALYKKTAANREDDEHAQTNR